MDDLISRQAVENITWEEPSYTDPLNVLTEVREKVRALPSVENKGDLISKQAVLDELEKWDWQDLYLPIHFKQILDDVPSVENKGDLISRQVAIVQLSHNKNGDDDCDVIIQRDIETIKQLPSVENRGTWRHYEGVLYCPKCGAEFYDEIMEYTGDEVPKHCPDCGADMRGET